MSYFMIILSAVLELLHADTQGYTAKIIGALVQLLVGDSPRSMFAVRNCSFKNVCFHCSVLDVYVDRARYEGGR
jgi:hypothetical protein